MSSQDGRCFKRSLPAGTQRASQGCQEKEENLEAADADKVQQTNQAADSALTVSAIPYKAGAANDLTVLTAQVTLLSAQVTAVNLRTCELVARKPNEEKSGSDDDSGFRVRHGATLSRAC